MREISMSKISKSFPGVQALDAVDFCARGGEVHALVGANGAGKSTLIKILGGVLRPDSGNISIDGQKTPIDTPMKAQSVGISIIHQEYSLIRELSITQNVFLGKEIRRYGVFLRTGLMDRKVREILQKFGLNINPRTRVDQLSSGEQQMVEILRSLNSNAWVIVMDEPTSALSEADKEKLFTFINQLKRAGVAIIYITHHMPEIFRVAGLVTVLRDGKLVKTVPTNETSEEDVVRMMVGTKRPIGTRQSGRKDKIALEVRNLTRDGMFQDITFQLWQGEILGLTGLRGSGCSAVVRSLFGFLKTDSGSVVIDGNITKIHNPRDAVSAGLGFVPENRKEEGVVGKMNANDNLTICSLDRISKFGWISRTEERRMSSKSIGDFSIKVSSPYQLVEQLSGGNQQKVAFAKWLSLQPRILLLNEPTRGIDVGAKSEIHALVYDLARKGLAVLVVSFEVDEIAEICNRVIVFRGGRVADECSEGDISEERIFLAATGARS
jgi:ribose transport system ATP-binding protein